MPLRGLEWAQLTIEASDGRGKEVIGKRLTKKEILSMTQNEVNEQKSRLVTKEIIKEKEIITKVRCHYCHHAYNETIERCPNCGAHS